MEKNKKYFKKMDLTCNALNIADKIIMNALCG